MGDRQLKAKAQCAGWNDEYLRQVEHPVFHVRGSFEVRSLLSHLVDQPEVCDPLLGCAENRVEGIADCYGLRICCPPVETPLRVVRRVVARALIVSRLINSTSSTRYGDPSVRNTS